MSSDASAHDLLSSALRAHIDAVRKASKRVVSSGVGRRPAAKGPGVKNPGGAGANVDAGPGASSASPGVANAAESDAEAVHDFRVALRRLRTALQPARDIYGKKRLRAIGEGLKRFADVTGALRDEEVLREMLLSLELPLEYKDVLAAWVARRAKQERARRLDVVKFLREHGGTKDATGGPGVAFYADEPTLEEGLAQLEKRLDAPKSDEKAVDLAQRAIDRAREKIRELASATADDAAAMHALRIRFKRLRYTAELFTPVLGDEAARIAKEASRLQTKLGDLHDLDEALVRMGRAWGLPAEVRTAVIEALRAARAHMAKKCEKELAAAQPMLRGDVDEGKGSEKGGGDS
jgi:CHAD domain-containing protein